MDRTSGTGTSEAEMEDQPEQNAQQTTESDPAIELQEFPWATGDIGDIETVGPVASGEQTRKLPPQLCRLKIYVGSAVSRD